MNSKGGLKMTRPVSVWNKPLQADFRALFKSLSSTAAHTGFGSWEKAMVAAKDALIAVGLKDDPGQLAWLLIRRALTQAIFELADEIKRRLRTGAQELKELPDKLNYSLEEAELVVDRGFFNRPAEISILEPVRQLFREWLIGAGLTEAEAEGVTGRLERYFVFALCAEWSDDVKKYAPIRDALGTPFAPAEERERAWFQYHAWLQRQIDEPMFDEPFSLRQIYIPLRAYWEEKKRGKAVHYGYGLKAQEQVRRNVVSLERELLDWVDRADRDDALRILSGGPGSGKSSFAKMIAAQMAHSSVLRILYVPLQHFEPTGDLVEALEDFASEDPYLPEKPLDLKNRNERILIFLDGLDELALQGKVAKEASQKLVREVLRSIESLNRETTRIQVILGGRELVIQATREEYRRYRVYHLLGYVVTEDANTSYHDPAALLSLDHRNEWWQIYGRLSGRSYSELPQELSGDRLLEVTAQPLLNYLFALSFDHGEIEFSDETSLNEVYRDLLTAVFKRGWERHPHRAIQGVSEGHFVRILEEIALAAWHGDGRTATVREIEGYCAKSGLTRVLDIFQEGAKSGVTRLLTAFYFRQKGVRRGGDRTFEFTHKSFGEYLAARRIVRSLATINMQRARREENPDDGWDERDALAAWADVCGPTRIDMYITVFLRNEICLRHLEECRIWQTTLQELVGFMLRFGMPMERLEPPIPYREQKLWARNAEETMMAALSACSEVTGELSKIDWPSQYALGEWANQIRGQRTGDSDRILLSYLNSLNAPKQVLVMTDMKGAFLAMTNLDEANLSGANLQRATLNNARFKGANLEFTHLDRANFENADLEDANLIGATLVRAKLAGARLLEADLGGADLVSADLGSADLRNANLSEANLESAILDGANLGGANLVGARGLTKAQVDSALTSRYTKLPPEIDSQK